MHKISIVIPVHDMENKYFFLERALRSVHEQTYKDYEIIITEEGKMAENVNAGVRRAKGDIVKILAMDDYLAAPTSLQEIADAWEGGWLVTACEHVSIFDSVRTENGELILAGTPFNYHEAEWSDRMLEGYNTIGGMSVVAFANDDPPEYDENLSWLIDVTFYQELFNRYGNPVTLDKTGVLIGIGEHQMTNILTNEDKLSEEKYVRETYL